MRGGGRTKPELNCHSRGVFHPLAKPTLSKMLRNKSKSQCSTCQVPSGRRKCRELTQAEDPAGVTPPRDPRGNLGEFGLPLSNLLQTPDCLLMFCTYQCVGFFDQHQWKRLQVSFQARDWDLVHWLIGSSQKLQYVSHKGSVHADRRELFNQEWLLQMHKTRSGIWESISVTILGL